ncbi:hypothetical protein BsWGS_15104 [Bradybaena similaris]
MAALIRYNALIYRNFLQTVSKILSVPKSNGFIKHLSERSAATAAANVDMLLDKVRHKLNINAGISQELFQTIYSSSDGSLTDQDFTLLLHVCTNGPFDSPTKKRTELADELWNKMEQMGIKPSTKIYNIKLRVYISNKTRFSPLDELLKLKSLGLNPDRVTYGLLLEEFCQQGNIEGANSVLEAFKTADLLLGISMFNSFITGHLKAGSPEEALNILDVMRSRGLTPDADSYFRFASHYAEEGDIDSVIKYINQADSENVFLDQSALLDLYRTMVTSGHSNKVEPLLKIITEKGVYRTLTVQKTCQLVSDGYNEAAFQLYSAIPKSETEKPQTKDGSFLLKAMIINGQNAEEIWKVAEKIAEISFRAQPHSFALLYAYKAEQTDLAVQLLEMMKAKNFEIKVPHITPAIVNYRNAKNKEGLYKVLRMLLELDEAYCLDDSVECLLTFGYPALRDLGETREDIVKNLQEYEKSLNSVFFIRDLAKSYSTALSNAAGKEWNPRAFQWFDFDTHLLKHLKTDPASFADVMAYLGQHGLKKDSLLSLCGLAVIQLARSKNWDSLDKLVTAFQEKNLKLRTGIKNLNFYSEAPEEVKGKLDQLCDVNQRSGTPTKYFFTSEQLKPMTTEELENCHKQHPGNNNVKIALLNRVLETNDLENIKMKLREFETANFKLNFMSTLHLVNKFTELGDVESAVHYFHELTKANNTNYNIMIPLSIGVQLVKAGKIKDALEMIEAANNSTFPRRSEDRKLFALRAMLDNAPTVHDAETLHSDICSSTSLLVDKEPIRIHAAYITRVLKEADDDDLLARLRKLYEAYHVFPCMESVLVRFIEKQDVNQLKKVMDLGLSVFGNNFFHLKLAMCFLRCGMPAKAITVLKTPQLQIHERVLVSECQYFLKAKRVDCLESLMKITKDLPVSRALMLKYLLEGCVAVDDLTKATKVLEEFAESLIILPKDTAELLVKAYVSHNLPVPASLQEYKLQVPTVAEAEQTSSSSSSSESDSESPTPQTEQVSQDGTDARKKDHSEA